MRKLRNILQNLSTSAQPSSQLAETAERLAIDNDLTGSDLALVKIPPRLTDREIDNWIEPHYIITRKSGPTQNLLFLFLPGSNGLPKGQRQIMQQAASLGYPVIGLRYPNSWTVRDLCLQSLDCDCHEKIRLEILDGAHRSDEVEISRTNSIENRLVKLLSYLDQHDAAGNWQNYLEGDAPCWDSIILAGHSQGGGQAAVIARQHEVARVIMMAAPADYSKVLKAPAPWLSKPHATPTERYYGFTHVQDPGLSRQLQAWELLGLGAYGAAINVDAQTPPYNHSHQLVTDIDPSRPGKYHGSIVVDHNTPKGSSNLKVLQQVWHYLLNV
jgi:pimeloyl-ACP methyl ester carboxylesterase